LEQHLDFNKFLESTLVPEVQIHEHGYNILRRRVAISLGQWVPVKPEALNKDAIYQIFQYLLNKQDPLNDLVVRITAGRQLRNVLGSYEFSAEHFIPYATPTLQSIMALIQEVELPETKMGLLETVRVAVVKMEDHVCENWALLELTQLMIADLSFLRPNNVFTPATVGTIRRGTFDEAGHPNFALVINRVIEGKVCEIPCRYPPTHTQFNRTGFGESYRILEPESDKLET
jgi:hypothetical protein